MPDEILQETAAVLQTECGLQLPEGFSEKALLEALALRLAAVIEQGPERFYQLMYRLDIPERKLEELRNYPDVAVRLATLVYERQVAKAISRRQHRQSRGQVDPDLEW